MLCYAMLCFAVLCYAMLCYAVLCYAMLCYEVCTGCSSVVLLNSLFTKSVYTAAFPLLRALQWAMPPPAVLYPAIDARANAALPWPRGGGGKVRLVSLNRYERKKQLELALLALQARPCPGPTRAVFVRPPGSGQGCSCAGPERLPPAWQELRRTQPRQAASVSLVLAGGWDPRLEENVSYLEELKATAASAGLADAVEFRTNVSDAERRALFAECSALVYTPTGEHFGIVPIEAMA